MKSAANTRRYALSALAVGAALFATLWCLKTGAWSSSEGQEGSAPENPRTELLAQPPAVEEGAALLTGTGLPGDTKGARAEGAQAQLRVRIAKHPMPLSRPLRVGLLKGAKVLEARLVSEHEPGQFWTEIKTPLVLALEEASLPSWSIGPRSSGDAGPGLPGWAAFHRVQAPHQDGLDVEVFLEEASHLQVLVRLPDGEPAAAAPVLMRAPSLGGKIRTNRLLTSEEGLLSVTPAWPGLYEFSPISAPGGGAVSAPAKVELVAGERSTLNIVLEEGQGSLFGVVLDQWDEPVAGESLSISWQGWSIRSTETDPDGSFLAQGLPEAPVTVSLRQRPASPLSALDPVEIERVFDPITAAPLGGEGRDLGELRVIRAAQQISSAILVGAHPEDLDSMEAYLTFPLEPDLSWKALQKTPRKKLQISDDGSLECPTPGPAQRTQISVWKEGRMIGTTIVERQSPSPIQIHVQP